MITHLSEVTELNNGVKMPWMGLGVWRTPEGQDVVQAVKAALQAGYRSIDTAAAYKNEEGVGKALRESGVARSDVFVTTKVWNSDQAYDSTLKAFETSLNNLQLDYIDLYLIHWPVQGKYKDTWRALERLYREGRVRAIGVSNFHVHHLQDLLRDAEVVPAVDQVEFHPMLAQPALRAFCREQGIQFEAWSPLMQGQLMDHPILQEIAQKHGKTVAQVVLRWDLQHGVVTIPKSVRPERIAENARVFDFELSNEDMARINALNEDRRVGPDPDNFDF